MSALIRQGLLKWDTAFQARLSPSLKTKWNHPAGPKTVHFWSPVVKWGLVIAGASDFTRPVETLSLNQSLSLALTGAVGITQVSRILLYRSKLTKQEEQE